MSRGIGLRKRVKVGLIILMYPSLRQRFELIFNVFKIRVKRVNKISIILLAVRV